MKKGIILTTLTLLLVWSSQGDSAFSEAKKLRIISLAPSTTEILFALGLDSEIVGVSTFCNYPEAALGKEKVGTFSQPDIEKILLLKPDIIFATGLEQAAPIEGLRQLKLKIYISDPRNMQELFDSIRAIGKAAGREKEAGILVDRMKNKISQIETRLGVISQDEKPKVYIEIWHAPSMTAGKGSFVDELISLAGGINIAHDTPRPYSSFSPEQVINRDPDFIFLAYMSEEAAIDIVRTRLGWNKIKAVKNNCIYNDINPDLFLRPGPRLVEGLEKIQKRLHR